MKLATWVIDQRRLGTRVPTIDSAGVEGATSIQRLLIMDRVQRLYRYLQHELPGLGKSLRWDIVTYLSHEDTAMVLAYRSAAQAWTESVDESELEAIVAYGAAQGMLWHEQQHLSLSLDGWRHLEELDNGVGASDQAFVAMWFGPEVSLAYADGIAPAIVDCGFVPMRIDQKEHANRIDDEIIAEIRRSRFVVADFTCGVVDDGGQPVAIPRGGVYYEAGFAQGLGIPVIWMCRQDHIDHVHFDTRQFNHITWTDAADLRVKLKNRIGAVLGDGPHVAR